MAIFGKNETDHKKFIDRIYDGAGKSLLVKNKASMSFDAWNTLVAKVKDYVKKNDTSFEDTAFRQIDLKQIELREFFIKSLRDEKTIDDLNTYVESLNILYNQYLRAAKRIGSEQTTPREKRWAQEALAALVNVMQLGALHLQQDILDIFRAQIERDEEAAKLSGKVDNLNLRTEEFKNSATKLKKQSLIPGKVDELLESFREKKFITFSSDEQFDALKKRIAALADLSNPGTVGTLVSDVRGYAQKYNKEAWSENNTTSQTTQKKFLIDQAAIARKKAKEIGEKFFTSRSKRYAYELYADLWQKIASLKSN